MCYIVLHVAGLKQLISFSRNKTSNKFHGMKTTKTSLARISVGNQASRLQKKSFSTQLSMNFKLLLNVKMARMYGIFRFKLPKPIIYPAHKCQNASNSWHLKQLRGLSQKFVDSMDNFVQTRGKSILRLPLLCPLY